MGVVTGYRTATYKSKAKPIHFTIRRLSGDFNYSEQKVTKVTKVNILTGTIFPSIIWFGEKIMSTSILLVLVGIIPVFKREIFKFFFPLELHL